MNFTWWLWGQGLEKILRVLVLTFIKIAHSTVRMESFCPTLQEDMTTPKYPRLLLNARLHIQTHPLDIAIETEDIEDSVCIHLESLQAVHHDNGGVCVSTVLARGRGRGSIAWGTVAAAPTTPSHWWAHTASLVGRWAIALVVSVPVPTLSTCTNRKHDRDRGGARGQLKGFCWPWSH